MQTHMRRAKTASTAACIILRSWDASTSEAAWVCAAVQTIAMINPGFSTHNVQMSQRYIVLSSTCPTPTARAGAWPSGSEAPEVPWFLAAYADNRSCCLVILLSCSPSFALQIMFNRKSLTFLAANVVLLSCYPVVLQPFFCPSKHV